MLTVWQIALGILCLFVIPAYSETPPQAPRIESKEQTPNPPQPKNNSDASPKSNSPLPTIPMEPPPKVNTKEPSNNAQHASDEASEYWTIFGRWVKVTDTLLVIFTGLLFGATVFLYRATRDLVESAEKTAAMEMRAYIAVIICDAVFQESGKGLRFEAKPRIINNGRTPAHNVRYRATVDILPIDLPNDFTFPLPETYTGGAVMGPQQHFDIGAIVTNYVLDPDVEDIKRCRKHALYIWGVVYYTDVFGSPRETKFCHMMVWFGIGDNERVWGYYNARHNEAT